MAPRDEARFSTVLMAWAAPASGLPLIAARQTATKAARLAAAVRRPIAAAAEWDAPAVRRAASTAATAAGVMVHLMAER